MASGIIDTKDILDFQDYLSKKAKEIKCMDHVLGPELVTFPQYISGSRSIMFTSHLKQLVVLNKPEFPRVFTNYENTFGRLSSSYKKTKDNVIVHKIVHKYDWDPNHLYIVFFYNQEEDKYYCIEKHIAEELTEKFGYGFNNEKLDSLKEGEKVKKGTVLWKSSSYDEDNNYCFGLNALTGYLIDNRTIEDAVVVSESFAKRAEAKEVETVKITVNDNDILVNLYGDLNDYKGFPDIGEKIKKKIICSKRRIDNGQILFDMKRDNLSKSNPLNDKEYYSNGVVMDINIYPNKPLEEIPEVQSNEQILKYLYNQKRYWQEIYDVCSQIEESGSDYDDDIGYLLGRSRNYLDPNYKWKDNDTIYSNMIIEISVQRDVPLNRGYKLSGRYGNKGVISTIVPDDEMPTLDNGRHLDIIFNALGVVNRLNSAQLFEVSINFLSNRIIEKLSTFKTMEEKEELLFKYLSYFNERNMETELKKYYDKLNGIGKIEFWESINQDGIFINLPPISTGKPLFDIIAEIHEEFPWIKPYDVYVKKWGRQIKLLNPLVVGEEYIIRLKQTAKKNFSVRSTGYLSQKGIPEKSTKNKHNQQPYSTTPIKLGRDENNNLAIGVDAKLLAKFHLFYRNSPAARREVEKLYTKDILNFKKFKTKKRFKNRNVEILNAYFKASGYHIDNGIDGVEALVFDDNQIDLEVYKGETFIGTKSQMRDYLLEEKYHKDFYDKYTIIGTQEDIDKGFEEYKDAEREKSAKYFSKFKKKKRK